MSRLTSRFYRSTNVKQTTKEAVALADSNLSTMQTRLKPRNPVDTENACGILGVLGHGGQKRLHGVRTKLEDIHQNELLTNSRTVTLTRTSMNTPPPRVGDGKYLHIIVHATGRTVADAITELASHCGIARHLFVAYASVDPQGCWTCSVYAPNEEGYAGRIHNAAARLAALHRMWAQVVGDCDVRGESLGQQIGMLIRNVSEPPSVVRRTVEGRLQETGFLNFFAPSRFRGNVDSPFLTYHVHAMMRIGLHKAAMTAFAHSLLRDPLTKNHDWVIGLGREIVRSGAHTDRYFFDLFKDLVPFEYKMTILTSIPCFLWNVRVSAEVADQKEIVHVPFWRSSPTLSQSSTAFVYQHKWECSEVEDPSVFLPLDNERVARKRAFSTIPLGDEKTVAKFLDTRDEFEKMFDLPASTDEVDKSFRDSVTMRPVAIRPEGVKLYLFDETNEQGFDLRSDAKIAHGLEEAAETHDFVPRKDTGSVTPLGTFTHGLRARLSDSRVAAKKENEGPKGTRSLGVNFRLPAESYLASVVREFAIVKSL